MCDNAAMADYNTRPPKNLNVRSPVIINMRKLSLTLTIILNLFSNLLCLKFPYTRNIFSRIHAGKGFGANSKDSKSKDKVKVKILNEREITQSQVLYKKSGEPSWVEHIPTLNVTYPGISFLHSSPPIIEINDFFDADLCDNFIKRAQEKGYSIPSQTFSSMTASIRTSTTWYLNYQVNICSNNLYFFCLKCVRIIVIKFHRLFLIIYFHCIFCNPKYSCYHLPCPLPLVWEGCYWVRRESCAFDWNVPIQFWGASNRQIWNGTAGSVLQKLCFIFNFFPNSMFSKYSEDRFTFFFPLFNNKIFRWFIFLNSLTIITMQFQKICKMKVVKE